MLKASQSLDIPFHLKVFLRQIGKSNPQYKPKSLLVEHSDGVNTTDFPSIQSPLLNTCNWYRILGNDNGAEYSLTTTFWLHWPSWHPADFFFFDQKTPQELDSSTTRDATRRMEYNIIQIRYEWCVESNVGIDNAIRVIATAGNRIHLLPTAAQHTENNLIH